MSGNSSPSHSTDTSLSLSPGLLPEKNALNEQKTSDQHSSISEHISSVNSLENDRSLLEIEISNIPDLNTILGIDNESDLINASPPNSLNYSNISHISNTKSNSACKNVKSVLEEILHNEQFKSERSDRLDSNDDVSLNIFDGINLDDNSITNYVRKLHQHEPEYPYHDDTDAKVRSLEDALSVKDSIIQALNVEVESLKDLASNPSTLSMSMNTTLTEYKMFQDDCATKFVNFENALAHRDSIIAKLKDSLISSQKQEDDMRAECEQYSKDIQCVQKELAEAVEYIKNNKIKQCKCLEKHEVNALRVSDTSDKESNLNAIYAQLDHFNKELSLNSEHVALLQDVKLKISNYLDDTLCQNKFQHQSEINKLQDKHVKEMEDTRKFYEEKCADLMSNELLSPGRKLSDDESQSEDDLGDLSLDYSPKHRGMKFRGLDVEVTPEVVIEFKKKVDAASVVLNKYDMENLGEEALDSLKQTMDALNYFTADLTSQEYQRQIVDLKEKVSAFKHDKELADVEIQANLGDPENEIKDIEQNYQQRLAEQVELARADIMLALAEQFSKIGNGNKLDEQTWPQEFIDIRNNFVSKYEKEIETLRRQVESYKKNSEPQSSTLVQINFDESLKERENIYRRLLLDCFKYFSQCEEELNTTVFEELTKNAAIFDTDQFQSNFDNLPSQSSNTSSDTAKRVHLAPNIQEFIDRIDSNADNSSLEFGMELATCLNRLKSEANAILALAVGKGKNGKELEAKNDVENEDTDDAAEMEDDGTEGYVVKIQSLTEQLEELTQYNKKIELERIAQEQALSEIVNQKNACDYNLRQAEIRIGELVEQVNREQHNEGYGEMQYCGFSARSSLAALGERVRAIVSENRYDGEVLQLVQDLAKECEEIVQEARRDQVDLSLQLESADKKLKSTQKFLEEQAAEREQERDEAQKIINTLREQLKDRQKDRAGYERVNEVTLKMQGGGDSAGKLESCAQCIQVVKSVEGFEQQMQEMSKLIADGEKRFQEVNTERGEAIEKIGLLRDIIKDLEKQIKTKEDLEQELKFLLGKQREANDDLINQLEAANNTSDFQTHIIKLEEEVEKLRRASDIVGNEGLIKQIQLQLHELELSVDKNIREIENLYASRSVTTCSTPSEEMSVQDQIRPKTPNSSVDDCEVPLQQLARLKEKLLKHSRAENSAIKRIQDMELQLLHAKQEHDELHNEKDVLQEQVSEQLVLISSLQMRLDDQRIRAEHVQKQANASLEMRIYDLENDLQSLRDKLQSRESTIKQLNKILDETKQRLKDREEELSSTLEESEICELKTEIEKLKNENEMMRQKIESDAQNAHILPSLVDNIIADKNKDIDNLRLRLQESERQFEMFRSLSTADKTEEIRGALSFFNISSPERMRCASSINSLNATKFVPEISSIEKVGPPNVNYTTDVSLMKPNSTEIQKTAERHVHFEDDSANLQISAFTADIEVLKDELQQVKDKLNEAETTVSELRVDLAEAKMHLTEREKQLNDLLADCKRKDDMYMKLAREKRDIEKQFDTLDTIRISIEELQKNEAGLKELLRETREKYEEKESLNLKLQNDFKNYQLAKEEEIVKLSAENKLRCEALVQDFDTLSKELEGTKSKFNQEIGELKRLLEDRECELEILNEDVTRYQNEIHAFEDQLKQPQETALQGVVHKKEMAEKELEIVKLKSTIESLKRETGNILDHLIVKEEIIDTMKVDSEALRINLETIKAKMNETGNIYDLRQKLVRERELNAQLHAENSASASIDDVADQVRKQLNVSALLDDKILTALSSGDFNTLNDSEDLEMALSKERQSRVLLEERIKFLEGHLHEAQETVKQLQDSLDDQKKLFDHVQVEDTNMMSQIRAKLEEAMENEMEYEKQLNKEKAMRSQLENELTILRRNSNSATTTSTTEYISLGNQQEQRLQREVKQLQEEVSNLKREIKNLKKGKNSAECELKYSKEMLNLKTVEVGKLEKRIAERESEIRIVQDELRQVKHELDMKTWEVENGKGLVSSLEQEKLQLSVQVNLLESKQSASVTSTVPDVFLQKMKDLGELVTEHINENKLMSDTISKLTTERNHLEGKIRLLEEKDRDRLHVPFDDPVARANHLFGKYLRADSYRHALSYQKKYLIGLLATYQDVIAHPLNKFEPKRRHTKQTGVNRFRAVAVVFIAIFRMKYMVQRWHSGSRSGAYMSLQRKFRSGHPHVDNNHLGTHFQVGKPVSGDHFRIGARQNFNVAALHQQHLPAHVMNQGASTSSGGVPAGVPWSGMSPPSKDPAHSQTLATHAGKSQAAPETFEQLRPPTAELDSYFERFNLIQQRLGTTLNSFNS